MDFNYDKFERYLGKNNVEKYILRFLEKKEIFETEDSDELTVYYIS